MLCEGRGEIIEVPPDRWDVRRFYDPDPNKSGKTYTKHGAYLYQPIDRMDALFFGILPREVETLDPPEAATGGHLGSPGRRRISAERTLAESTTGVFIGGFIVDHTMTTISVHNRDLVGTYSAMNFTHTMLSAHIAYARICAAPI